MRVLEEEGYRFEKNNFSHVRSNGVRGGKFDPHFEITRIRFGKKCGYGHFRISGADFQSSRFVDEMPNGSSAAFPSASAPVFSYLFLVMRVKLVEEIL